MSGRGVREKVIMVSCFRFSVIPFLPLLGFLSNPCRTKWRTATVEMSCKITRLESSLATFQDPTKADSLLRVDKSLSETKEVLTKTIEAVLARGEKLDDLVDKSAELSASSKAFYKTAKKTNSCCVMQ